MLQVVVTAVGAIIALAGAVPFTVRAWLAFAELVGGPVYAELAAIVVGTAVAVIGLVHIDDGQSR